LEDGLFGLGPAWYHLGTSAAQTFLGHPGEPDFIVFDFGVTVTGSANPQGRDAITHFERGLDDIVVLNSFAEISPGVSYNAVAEGIGRHASFEETIEYRLVHLEFDRGAPIQIDAGDIGQLRFVDLI